MRLIKASELGGDVGPLLSSPELDRATKAHHARKCFWRDADVMRERARQMLPGNARHLSHRLNRSAAAAADDRVDGGIDARIHLRLSEYQTQRVLDGFEAVDRRKRLRDVPKRH